MKNLVKFQARKFLRNKSTWLLLAGQLLFLVVYLLAQQPDDPAAFVGFRFMTGTLGDGIALYLIAIYISSFACEDRNNDVVKNIYARGYRSSSVLVSELLATLAFGLFSCLVNWLGAFVLGAIRYGVGACPDHLFLILLAQIFAVSTYTALFFLVAKVLMKPAAVYAVNIIIPMMIGFLFSGLDSFLSRIGLFVSPYSPDILLKTAALPAQTPSALCRILLVSAVYLVLSTLIAVLVNRKRPA